MTRGDVRRWLGPWGSLDCIDRMGRAGTGPRRRERAPWGNQGAAIHHHSLDRLNAINDLLYLGPSDNYQPRP